MTTMQASQFKAKCLAVLDRVAATGETVTITKRGRIVARLVPAVVEESALYPQLGLVGSVQVLGDIMAPVVSEDELTLEDGLL